MAGMHSEIASYYILHISVTIDRRLLDDDDNY